MWQSTAKWPYPNVDLGNTDNTSTDKHATEEEALAVCRSLEENGFGGDGRVFPLETRVKEIKDDDISSDAVLRPNTDGDSFDVAGTTIIPLNPNSDKPCLGCAMADTLLSMSVTAHRERLLTMDNKQCDQVFDKIVDYLAKKYPARGGCPALD